MGSHSGLSRRQTEPVLYFEQTLAVAHMENALKEKQPEAGRLGRSWYMNADEKSWASDSRQRKGWPEGCIEVVDWSGEGLGTGIVKTENGLKSSWSLYPSQGNLHVTILQCFYLLCC